MADDDDEMPDDLEEIEEEGEDLEGPDLDGELAEEDLDEEALEEPDDEFGGLDDDFETIEDCV